MDLYIDPAGGPLAKADDSLNRIIESRSRGNEAAREREESWKASVRTYHAERQEARRHQWRSFHTRQARIHAGLAEEHAARAEALSRDTATERSRDEA